MPEQPPVELVAKLERLGLATAAQVERMGRRVQKLARDVPRFDSIWIDTLAQARVLTPFQAAEFNAGRGESLRIGPYLLCEKLPHPYYVACYRAKNVDSGEMVRLAVTENGQPCVAEPWIDGRTAAEWMIHHGRFQPEIVLEIARAMLEKLVELEKAGVCHGDVSAASLILTDAGEVSLSLPGLRGIVRPEEGYAHLDLLPEAFDSLSPERIASGTPPNTASDIYACGCVWWQLLCGRPPLPGGSSLAKLRAAQAGGICEVRRYAPDVSPQLAAVISACLEREPSKRPESMARLSAMLGSPTRSGKEALADCLARSGRHTIHWTTTVRSIRKSNRTPLWLAGAACCLAAMVAIFWPSRSIKPSLPHETAVAKADVSAKREGQYKKNQQINSALTLTLSQRERGPNPKSRDESVLAAAYQSNEEKPRDLVLSADKPLALSSLDLRPGIRIRAPSGKRAKVFVPHSGIVVNQEDVRFENIDFVWKKGSELLFRDNRTRESKINSSDPFYSAIIQLCAGRAEFRGCSFRNEDAGNENNLSAGPTVSAISWRHPERSENAEISLPNGRIRFVDCLLTGVGVGLDCHTTGSLEIEWINTLHQNAGPLVRLDHCPRPDEPLSLTLSQTTLRDTGPLIECIASPSENQPGEISIQATACVFSPKQGEPLVHLLGKELSGHLSGMIRWTGQGSLVEARVPILIEGDSNGHRQTVDESSLSIAGLVRSEVGFAGESAIDPAASRILRWQAPLQSSNPPGIDPVPIPCPTR